MLSTTAALYGQGMGEKVALITDGRFSGGTAASASAMWALKPPWAGRSRSLRTAMSSLSTRSRVLSVDLSEAELARRAKEWKPRPNGYGSGCLWKYAQTVGPACKGAVTHPGGVAESECYADI